MPKRCGTKLDIFDRNIKLKTDKGTKITNNFLSILMKSLGHTYSLNLDGSLVD